MLHERVRELLGKRCPAVATGYVYVIPTERLVENKIICKIGFSYDPKQRFLSLCTNNPHKLDLAAARAFRGTTKHESTLKHLTREWCTDAENEWRAFPSEVWDALSRELPVYGSNTASCWKPAASVTAVAQSFHMKLRSRDLVLAR